MLNGCFPVNLLHIFGTHFLKNISGWLLLERNKLGRLLGVLGFVEQLLVDSTIVLWIKRKEKDP